MKEETQNVTCELDEETNVLYCNYVGRPIRAGEVVKTIKVRENPLTLEDYDKNGNLLGIEVLQPPQK